MLSINEYQSLAMRTNDGRCTNRLFDLTLTYLGTEDRTDLPELGELINGALGLPGEAGEVADAIKKYIFHGHEFNREEIIKELGDVCWYVVMLCHAINVPLEVVLNQNIEKLKKRYPDGFSESASINRTE